MASGKKGMAALILCLAAVAGSPHAVAYDPVLANAGQPQQWLYQPGQGPHYSTYTSRHAAISRSSQLPLKAEVAAPVAALAPAQPAEPAWSDLPVIDVKDGTVTPMVVPTPVPAPLPPRPIAQPVEKKASERALQPKTEATIDVGIQGSHYHYHESSLAVKTQGAQFGVTAAATGTFGEQWFARLDGRYVGGPVHYKGSGESEADPNSIAEARLTSGRDFLWHNLAFTPYIGAGYRYLRNDARGVTTTGASGYNRESHYFFVPVGFQQRLMFANGSQLAFTAEFDHLLYGRQKSRLSDASSIYPDLTNRQKGGYGLHSDLMYKYRDWAFGPFSNYWNINQSDTACSDGDGTTALVCGYEPHNHTLEYGFQLRYSFY